MDTLPKPEIILTHESDLDGFVAGLLLQRLARHLFATEARLEAYNYNGWKLREPREKSAWVCDFSFEARLDKTDWLIIDHHATEARPKNAVMIHDLAKSAGLLCYDLCRERGLGSPALDRLVHLSNVADLFLEEDPDFVAANDYANLVKTYQFWNLHALIGGELERLLDHPLLEVMAVKRRIEDPAGPGLEPAERGGNQPDGGLRGHGGGQQQCHRASIAGAGRDALPGIVDVVSQGQQRGGGQLSQPQRRGAQGRRETAGGGHANASGATLPRSVKNIPNAVDYLRAHLNPPPKQDALNSLESLFDGLEVKKTT